MDSTRLLKPLLAPEGSSHDAQADERGSGGYSLWQAGGGGPDIGRCGAERGHQRKACVAVEAMEGTDAMLRRAAALTNGRPLRLVKASSGRAHLLFDVPVAGLATIETMVETGTTVLAMDAGRTLLLDRELMIERADQARIAMVGYPPL